MFPIVKLEEVKSLMPLLLIIFAGLISAIPILVFGFPVSGHDSINHAIFYNNFADQFRSGELYPRWLMNMNGKSVPNNEADLQLSGLKLESLLSKVHQVRWKINWGESFTGNSDNNFK
jgi:hypothetical protein